MKTQQDAVAAALKTTTQALQEQAAALGNTLSAHVDFLNKVQAVSDASTKNRQPLTGPRRRVETIRPLSTRWSKQR